MLTDRADHPCSDSCRFCSGGYEYLHCLRDDLDLNGQARSRIAVDLDSDVFGNTVYLYHLALLIDHIGRLHVTLEQGQKRMLSQMQLRCALINTDI